MKSLPVEYLETIEGNPDIVVVRKWDGFSEDIVNTGGHIRIFNRSGKEHTPNVPSLTSKIISAPDFRIRAEGVGPTGRLGSTKSILGSGPDHAIAYQQEHGNLQFVCHGLVDLRGEDLTHIPFGDKLGDLWAILESLRAQGLSNLLFERLVKVGKYSFFQEILAQGGEGVVVKNLRGLEEDFVKVKRVKSWDVVITGFTEGKGKYQGVIGAIRYGVFRDGKLVEVGKASGMTDAERAMFAANPDMFIGKVIELKGQEIGSEGRIRFPAFQRFRDDKLPEECLEEHLVD